MYWQYVSLSKFYENVCSPNKICDSKEMNAAVDPSGDFKSSRIATVLVFQKLQETAIRGLVRIQDSKSLH